LGKFGDKETTSGERHTSQVSSEDVQT